MKTVIGPKSTLDKLAHDRDARAGFPLPVSRRFQDGIVRNICSRCVPVLVHVVAPEYRCSHCGWTPADEGLAIRSHGPVEATEVKGIYRTCVDDDAVSSIETAKTLDLAKASAKEVALASCEVVEEKPPEEPVEPVEPKPIEPIDVKEIVK